MVFSDYIEINKGNSVDDDEIFVPTKAEKTTMQSEKVDETAPSEKCKTPN